MSRHSKIRLLIPVITIVALLAAGSMGATMGSFGDTETSMDNVARVISGWYDLAWGYRKPITINNSGSVLSDYQTNIHINTAALVSAGKMQADGADIRFTTSDGTTEIHYWIESGSNSAATSLWVKVPEIPLGESTIYMYYGYSEAAAASSFENVFPQDFFEDFFNDDSLVDWLASQGVVVGGGQAELDVSAGRLGMQDQVQLQGGVSTGISATNWSAQSFTVGITGFLIRVTVKVSKTGTPANPLVMQLRNAVGDVPGTEVLASVSLDPGEIDTVFTEKDFVLETPMIVEAGEKYALVFRTAAGSDYSIQYMTSDVYSNGDWSRTWNSGGTWNLSAGDIYFKTYVDTSWRVDQEQTGITGTRQVYDENWWAQSFSAGMSGELKQISLDMARIGTPPNEVTVEVRNVEQVPGEVLSQSQVSHADSNTVYGDNWESQTFRAGTDGDLTKVALRASSTGSPGDLTVQLRDVVAGYRSILDQSQTSHDSMRQVYGDNWTGQVFLSGLDGALGTVAFWASKSNNPPNPLTVELRDVAQVGEEILDQSAAIAGGWQFSVYDDDMTAQTFTVGTSGQLTSVALMTRKEGSPPNPLFVEIRNATGEQLPGTRVYATTSRSDISSDLSEHIFTFDSPPTLIAGVKYCIVVYTTGGTSANGYRVNVYSSDVYAGGQRSASWWGGIWEPEPDSDMYFKTFMTVPAYLPGDNVYATAGRSDIGAAGEYEFVFDTPHTVSPGTRYALVVRTEGGSSDDRYNVGYQGSDVYDGGSECTSEDAGDNWTLSDTDLYFKTYNVTAVGLRPGENVYAQATRGGIGAAGEYEFVFDTPHPVSVSDNYALVVFAGDGNASNYYRIFYDDSTAYALGRQSSSNDAGSNWTPDDEADLYFKVWVEVPAGYTPGNTVYDASTRDIFVTTTEKVEFLFDGGYSLAAGQRYAIVVRTVDGDASNYYMVSYQYPSAYPRGNEARTVDDGDSWVITDCDLWFMVYVEGGAVSDQYQTMSDDVWQVYGAEQVAQVFQVGMDGELRRIVLKAASAGSPPGALTVELRDAEQVSQQVLDQFQTVYSGNRNVYGDNLTSQLLRPAYSGTLDHVTLRVGETGSMEEAITVELRDVAEGFAYALDQSQTVYDGNRDVYADNWLAQLFQAGMTGDLGRVTLRAAKTGSPGGLIVELRDLVDIFQYVLDQVQDAYTGYRQVYGDDWSGQVFQAGSTGDLGRVALRLAAVGAPSGAVTVELRNVVQAFQYAVDQSQTAYTGNRQVDGDNWSAQLFQAGSDGDLGRITLRTAKVGSPNSDLTVELRDVVTISGDILDQSQTLQDSSSRIFGTRFVAQTFTAGSSGDLTKVIVRLLGKGSPQPVTVELRNVSAGAPGTSVLASVSRNDIGTVSAAEYEFVFPSPPPVSAGSQYAIVVSTSGGNNGNNHYEVYFQNADVYTGGQRFTSTNSGSTWTGETNDLYFETYVEQTFAAPGSTLASVTRNGIAAEGYYDFTFETPPEVSSGTNYAIVVSTGGGDAESYYTVAFSSAGGYADGNECSSTDGGGNWTSSEGTDLYFKTHMQSSLGKVPGSTVYASASRGDVTAEAEYDFTFDTAYGVTSGEEYAIVARAGGGDALNYYEVAYNSAGGYASGRECLSTDAGSSWAPSDGTDLYFETYMWSSVGKIPGDTVHATASRDDVTGEGDYDFTFATPHGVTSGEEYAIVARAGGGDVANYYAVAYNSAGGYANGRESVSTDGGSNWTPSDSTDLYFKTYVLSSLGNVPGQTVHATASRSDVTVEGDYDFIFDTPYSVTSGTDYAIVVYTSGGDASNYYRVAYNSAGGYANGRECLSTDAGSSWTPSGDTDLYFKAWVTATAIGYKPGDTVYATASRGDIGSLLEEYDFDFSGVAITGGKLYALVVKTEGGSPGDHYEVAFQSSDVYAWGNLSYTVDGGVDWTIADYDLWFKVYLDTSNAGVLRSVAIPLGSDKRLAKGIELSWSDTKPEGTQIRYRVEYYDGSNWTLVPDEDLPGNSAGFEDSPVGISTLATGYGLIRLSANLSATDLVQTPSIQDWKVTYHYRQYAAVPPSVSGIGGEE